MNHFTQNTPPPSTNFSVIHKPAQDKKVQEMLVMTHNTPSCINYFILKYAIFRSILVYIVNTFETCIVCDESSVRIV